MYKYLIISLILIIIITTTAYNYRRLDRKLAQGINKISWQSKSMIEMYVRDCLLQCNDVHQIIKKFKDAKRSIFQLCKTITLTPLVKIEKVSNQHRHRHRHNSVIIIITTTNILT
jgi:hypothetical protein